MAALSDRPSGQFCPHSSDLHLDRPTVRRVSQPDSDALDVRSAVHLLQVGHHREPPAVRGSGPSFHVHLLGRLSNSRLLFSATSDLLTLK